MKKIIILFVVTLGLSKTFAQNIGIGTITPNTSAQLDVTSTSKGMLIPRMNTTQRTAIPSPATGLLVFDNTTSSFWFRGVTKWIELMDSSNTIWKQNGADVFYNGGNVGIGTNTPDTKLHVAAGTVITGGTGGFLQLGSSLQANLALDNNGMQARNNGVLSDLFLQFNGGNVAIGGVTPISKLDVNGQITIRAGLPGADKILTSDANGTATWRNGARGTGFFVTRNTSQTLANNVEALINFSVITYDDGSNYNTANDYYNCPTAGFYHFDLNMECQTNNNYGGNASFTIELYVNGLIVQFLNENVPFNFNSFNQTLGFNYNLAAGDHISVHAAQSSGVSQSISGSFSGYRVY